MYEPAHKTGSAIRPIKMTMTSFFISQPYPTGPGTGVPVGVGTGAGLIADDVGTGTGLGLDSSHK